MSFDKVVPRTISAIGFIFHELVASVVLVLLMLPVPLTFGQADTPVGDLNNIGTRRHDFIALSQTIRNTDWRSHGFGF
jgi:hypothetical protein